MPDLIFNSYLYAFLTGTLLLFSIASFALAMVTITNAYRLRNVLISWRSGHIFGLPLFASFFLLTAFMLVGLAWYHQADSYYVISGAYVFIALNWFVSSYFMSKRYITDHGIVKNINDPSQTVPWNRVQDFIEYEAEAADEDALACGVYPYEGDSVRSSNMLMQQLMPASAAKPDASVKAGEAHETSQSREARIKAVIRARRNPKERDKSYTFIYMHKGTSRMPSESWQDTAEAASSASADTSGTAPLFHCFRLELYVPAGKVSPFRKILNHKLGRRFQHSFSSIPIHRGAPFRSR